MMHVFTLINVPVNQQPKTVYLKHISYMDCCTQVSFNVTLGNPRSIPLYDKFVKKMFDGLFRLDWEET